MFENQKLGFITISINGKATLNSKPVNRHGLITGATGTGKTVTLQNLTETFSGMGVPVFVADIRSDFSVIAKEYFLENTIHSIKIIHTLLCVFINVILNFYSYIAYYLYLGQQYIISLQQRL